MLLWCVKLVAARSHVVIIDVDINATTKVTLNELFLFFFLLQWLLSVCHRLCVGMLFTALVIRIDKNRIIFQGFFSVFEMFVVLRCVFFENRNSEITVSKFSETIYFSLSKWLQISIICYFNTHVILSVYVEFVEKVTIKFLFDFVLNWTKKKTIPRKVSNEK